MEFSTKLLTVNLIGLVILIIILLNPRRLQTLIGSDPSQIQTLQLEADEAARQQHRVGQSERTFRESNQGEEEGVLSPGHEQQVVARTSKLDRPSETSPSKNIQTRLLELNELAKRQLRPPAQPLHCESHSSTAQEDAKLRIPSFGKFVKSFVDLLSLQQQAANASPLEAIEIGGPSKHLLAFYPHLATLDNVLYSTKTMWEGTIPTGPNQFQWFKGKPKGYQYIADATSLSDGVVPREKYSVLLSCHNIEHVANPVKALLGFRQVLRPGGILVLVLPFKGSTFDIRREDTALGHLFEDYNQGVSEYDLTHLPEIVERLSIKHDPGLLQQAQERRLDPKKWLMERSLDNFVTRGLHHHVFSMETTMELLRCVGFRVHFTHRRTVSNYFVATRVD